MPVMWWLTPGSPLTRAERGALACRAFGVGVLEENGELVSAQACQ